MSTGTMGDLDDISCKTSSIENCCFKIIMLLDKLCKRKRKRNQNKELSF